MENVFDFANWVSKRDFDDPKFNFDWLREVILDYLYGKEDGGE